MTSSPAPDLATALESSGRDAMTPGAFESHAVAVLREEGMRITAPRIEVVRVLARSDRALNVYGIHEAVLARGRRIDVVSVYRIIATLRSLGLVAHVGMVDGYVARRFAPETGRMTAMLVEPESRRVREVDCGAAATQALHAALGGAGAIEDIRIEAAVRPGGLD